MLLMSLLLFVRLVIAVQLTRVAHRQNLPNLYWLAAFFFITCIGDISFTFFSLIWMLGIAVGLGEIALAMFIQQTFYRDRKSPFAIFMGISVVYALVDTIMPLVVPGTFPYFSPFNWIWLAMAGYQGYKQIASEKIVDDWVKARYRMVIAYSVIALAAPLQSLLLMASFALPSLMAVAYSSAIITVVQLFTIAGVVLEYLAWVMPGFFQRFLNRNFHPASQSLNVSLDMSEEEIMRQL